jgi:glycosyltransferase involved in cell wall biosynthesis
MTLLPTVLFEEGRETVPLLKKSSGSAAELSAKNAVIREISRQAGEPLSGHWAELIMADMNPLVSVIIPTYNREKFLPQSINSVIGQTYGNWELIIVDDRSTDNSEALVHCYMDMDKRIAYVRNTHKQGPAGARNQGQKLARGEYVAFLDSDDMWKSHHLKNIMDEFIRNDDIDWIYADSEIVEDGKIVTKSVFDELWKNKNELAVTKRGALSVLSSEYLLENVIRFGIYAGCQCSVIRRRVFDTNNFDEELFATEDWLFSLEAIDKKYKIAYLEKIHLTYRSHPNSISANLKGKSPDDNLIVFREFEKFCQTVPRKIQLTSAQKSIMQDKLAELRSWFIG